MKKINTNIQNKEVKTINESLLNSFINTKVLIESEGKQYIGVFNKFKNNYAVFNNKQTVTKAFAIENIDVLVGKNNKTNLMERIVQTKGGYKVTSEKGKNLGGPYKTMKQAKKRLGQVEYFKHVKENADLLLKEKLKDKFFKITEEIVNKDHKGRMTKEMQSSRDSTEKKLGDVKVVKGPPGRMDTPEEARFRLATYIEWKKKKSKGN